jgi:hypothetical protein
MKLVYALEALPESFGKAIFLAGPTPRTEELPSWRLAALKMLEQRGYDGVVFIPEFRDGQFSPSYFNQIEWEDEALNKADCILFWVPRDLECLPGFTTNHEHGEWFKSGKIVFGAPAEAPKTRYLRHKAQKALVPCSCTLEETVDNTLKMIGEGAQRAGGECQVPLCIWRTESFQAWYQSQVKAGNRLDGARVEWTFRMGPDRKFVFFWILRVDVYITKEGRHKTNEVVLSRPDIATIMLYRRATELEDSQVVLIREFRSPAELKMDLFGKFPEGHLLRPTLIHGSWR